MRCLQKMPKIYNFNKISALAACGILCQFKIRYIHHNAVMDLLISRKTRV